AAANDAARRRGEAEVAAAEAAKKRREAEAAASEATKRRGEAEAQRLAAVQATREAEAQRVAAEQAARSADRQRAVAEASARTALAAQQQAEASLAQLDAKRAAAEHAASEVETKMKAEAKAQAEVAAAKARKASDEELAAARAEAAKLADQRKRAEGELADRRKAVAMQQAEAARLETAAAQAKDAADREETRRAKLAQQREAEEQQLAALKQQKAAVVAAAQQPPAPAHSAKPAAKAPIAKVKNVNFIGGEGSGQIVLAIDGNADVHLGEVTPNTVEVIVEHAELAPKLERTLDVSRFGSPIRRVSSFRDRRTPDVVRLVAELGQPATPRLVRDATGARLHFTTQSLAHAPRVTNVPSPIVGGFGAVSTPVAQQSVTQVPPAPAPRGGRQRIYHGATVDFDFKDAPIHDLLRIIADTGHVNIVVPDTIDAKVTVRLKRVPWDQALDVILASHDLGYRREGNLYRIAPRKQLDQEDEAEAARREAAIKAESPRPEVVTLNYTNAGELKTKLEGMLSPKGHLEVDERTNALIVNDVAGNRAEIAKLAYSLDTQTPQITIEARIVEARSTFVRQFGVQWGGNALAGAAGGNATGLVWPSSISLAGGNEDQNTRANGVALPSNFAVNIPAAVATGEGGALGISLGSVGGNFNINLRLSALEDEGTVRIISAPKITVLNNKEAYIKQGVSIPISVVSAAGTQTQFVQADLQLKVTPYVSQKDCAIAMTLDVSKNEPDFVNVGARGDPTILRKEAHTVMLVNDGETTVLGGIYTRNSGLAYKKIPFFGDLPFLGWLFKNRRENDDRTEILVFITPKITNKASLRCVQ
ncbi:MAG: type IV pilus secretin PilQ, partial [Acidobacteriota bacterium]